MRFGILGETSVWHDDGSELALGGPARRALLALLLARAGHVVTTDALIDDLYGAGPPSDAGHALQSQVSRLRRLLGDTAPIERTAAGYRLAVDPEAVDAHRFEQFADQGREALRRGDHRLAAGLLREALALWRGAALADATEAPSVQAWITRLDERRLGALEDRIEADLLVGEHRAVVPELQDLAAQHPLRERLRGLLMRALHADGRPAEALVAYEEIRRLLADELGTDPSEELAAIHQALLRGDQPHQPRSLPAQLTSFVGRAEDLAKVAELLGTTRLVTLFGPGGSGKTRLSIEVASRAPDACLVELAPLRDGSDLPQAVLSALGLRESGGLQAGLPAVTAVERLLTALSDRPLLLVLDNCEHVVAAAAELADRLLAGCPKLRVLATGREPLGLTGEHVWPVRPLELSAAVQLFTERATAVRPGFDLSAGETGLAERICEAVDRLPLAIELAAARARTYDLAEMARRLDDRFRLLSKGSRTAGERHRTLRGVVAWSWDLLPEAERALARRLTVFVGGATAAAAEQVCGLPDPEDLLDSLVDKSLLELVNGRYRMLETIHAYGSEQLEQAGEAAAYRRAHAEYYLTLAQEADPYLRGEEQLTWLATLAGEHSNLQAALRRAVDGGAVELGLRLHGAMSTYLWMRGMRTQAMEHAVALLDQVGEQLPAELAEEYVLCALAVAPSATGRSIWDRHRASAEAAVTSLDQPRRYPVLTFLWPMVNASEGNPEVALTVIRRGQASADPWERAAAHLIWGYPHLAGGEFAEAEREFRLSLEGFRAQGDRWGTALALDALAGLADVCDDRLAAIAYADEALVLCEQIGGGEDVADLLCNRGDFRLRTKDHVGARADYERAAEVARAAGSSTFHAAALRGLADIARLEGDRSAARDLYEAALNGLEPHWVRGIGHQVSAAIGLGKLAETSGDVDEARSRYLEAVELAVHAGPLVLAAGAFEGLASLALTDGEQTKAAMLLGGARALRAVDAPDEPELAARIEAALGASSYRSAYQTGARLGPGEVLRLAGLSSEAIESSPRDGLW
ncbi:BTAD domain-containing putative transcriptional regulator [Flindersiella endophytica]